MIDARALTRDHAIKGLVFSIIWHLCFLILFVPVFSSMDPLRYSVKAVFLGDILNNADLSSAGKAMPDTSRRVDIPIARKTQDYFSKGMNVVYKPKAEVARNPVNIRDEQKIDVLSSGTRARFDKLVFGLDDYSLYLERVDFGELKRIRARDDLSSYVDFEVLLGRDGMVRSIRKTGASGDPGLDLYIMRKLRVAVFKDFIARGSWVGIRFKIKD